MSDFYRSKSDSTLSIKIVTRENDSFLLISVMLLLNDLRLYHLVRKGQPKFKINDFLDSPLLR